MIIPFICVAGYFLTLIFNSNLLTQLFTSSFDFMVTAVAIHQQKLLFFPPKMLKVSHHFPFFVAISYKVYYLHICLGKLRHRRRAVWTPPP